MEIKNDNAEAITGIEQPAVAEATAAAPAAAVEAETVQENPYKAEIERISAEKARKEEELSKAQFRIQELKKENKDLKRREPEEQEEDDVDDVRTAIDKAKAEAKEEFRRELAQDAIKSELSKFQGNPDRMNLIRYHYENTIQKSGYSAEAIRQDIELASVLADRVNSEKTQREILAATVSGDARSMGSIGAGIPPAYVPETKFSSEDLAIMRRHGLTEKDVK